MLNNKEIQCYGEFGVAAKIKYWWKFNRVCIKENDSIIDFQPSYQTDN